MTCPRSGKRCYPSKKAARKGCQTMGNRFRIYFCAACHSFHVTSRAEGR